MGVVPGHALLVAKVAGKAETAIYFSNSFNFVFKIIRNSAINSITSTPCYIYNQLPHCK